MKDPARRTKVVLRRLPPAIAEQALVDQVDARFAGRYDWSCFRPGNASQKNNRYSRLYLNFKSPEDVVEFAEFFNEHVFVNEKGAQFKALVEYAPSQQVPKSNIKKDPRQGTIMKDPEYLEFLELISKPTEHLPSAEIQLERKEAERAAAGKEAPVVTPLMFYVRQQRAAKSMAQRSGSNRLSRKVAGVVTSSSIPSKRASEKRRTSTSTYVLRDNGKEKPTYILVPKREEHTQRGKITAGTSDAASGGTSGSGQVVEAKNDKIVLLKGRARVDSNTSDGLITQQQLVAPMKNTPPSSSRLDQRLEASGRIIRTILSNKEGRHAISSQHEQEGHIINAEKDKRPPRVPNSHSIVKNQILENAEKSHFDEKHNHLHGEKIERHARNRDRPDRGVWAPRRYDKSASAGGTQASSSEFPLMQSHSGDNFSQQAGHGERKIDTRSHGGVRGGHVENGHRHANRRCPPRGLKETEISASTPDGKPSKRGSANYGAHERHSSKQISQAVEKFWILQLILLC